MPGGLDPSEMADRVVRAILANRFYILSAEGGNWRKSCESRLEDVRMEQNPRLSMSTEN